MEQDLGRFIPRIGAPSFDAPPERDDPRDGSGAVAMMGESRLPICPAEPALSQSLAHALREFTHPHPDLGLRWDLVTAREEAEAKRALPDMRARCRFATLAEWRIFLAKVATLTPNAPTGRSFEAFAVEVEQQAMRNTPVGALVECVGECQREKYFPKGEALHRIVTPVAVRLLRELSAMERIAAGDVLAKAKEAERAKNPPATPEERAAVKARLSEVEKLRAEQEAAERKGFRERMAAMAHRQPTYEDRKAALQAELAGLDRMLKLGPSVSMEERRAQVRLRLTNMERMERGERPLRIGEPLNGARH